MAGYQKFFGFLLEAIKIVERGFFFIDDVAVFEAMYQMAAADIIRIRHARIALGLNEGAAAGEIATLGQVNRARYFAL